MISFAIGRDDTLRTAATACDEGFGLIQASPTGELTLTARLPFSSSRSPVWNRGLVIGISLWERISHEPVLLMWALLGALSLLIGLADKIMKFTAGGTAQ